MSQLEEMLQHGDALILVDVQNDFCPGGALPIEDGDQVVPVLNRWLTAAVSQGIPVFASRDWHPKGHLSFQSEGGLWPPHCLQDSPGAAFHPDLNLPESTVLVTKGVRFDLDQNSVFEQTGLAVELHKRGITRLFVGGLAEDVCVLASVLDGLEQGFEVTLISDATRPVSPQGGEKARDQMKEKGARFTRTLS